MYILRMSIACISIILLTIHRQIHNIQLNSYNLDQQILWYKRNFASFIMNIILLISGVLYFEFNFVPTYYLILICLLGLLIENFPRRQKKKLVYTARVLRLIFLCIVLFILFFIPVAISKNETDIKYVIYTTALAPLIIFIAYLILLPVENANRKKYMLEAKKIIDANDNLYTIGITGSFGKTSVKYYLSTLLKNKYSVCFTPESFNTAMGATITIKNDLRNIDDIFICEMGARRIGDIKEICDIVSPTGAVITDVGNMHLDTFLNIDNVRKCKFELVDNVISNDKKSSKEKIILLNGDNKLIREKIKEYDIRNTKVYFYGFESNNDFTVSNISLSKNGTSFTFVDNVEKANFTFQTRLLGKYNIINLVAAISYAKLFGIDIEEMQKTVKTIHSVSHRLELISYDENFLLIDDAYNSNPNGARAALDVVKSFDGYTKIIITPGMVELYDKQDYENEEFARYGSKIVDYALVVGHTNRLSLDRGFESTLEKDKVINFERVEEAINFARNEIEGKRIVLLENDLTDNY